MPILNPGYFYAIGVVAILVALFFYRALLKLCGVIIVPDDSLGVVTKKYVVVGRNRTLPAGKIIALNGEAGYQADTLAPGMHMGLWPWQFTVDIVQFFVVPQGKIGIVQACDGAPLGGGRVVAKQVACDTFQDARAFLSAGGQRGPQVAIIPPGSWRINSLLFKTDLMDAIIIQPGELGVVSARDGAALPAGRILGKRVECNSYQDGQAFINGGGERGLQSSVITTGTYFINPSIFVVSVAAVADVPDNMAGIVTAREGKPLDEGEIAGPVVAGHNSFQDAQAFLDAGGNKGLQEQVLLAGRYFINPMFATVQIVPMTEVPIASVGVVIAYVGKEGHDVSGDAFKHGNLVSKGEKGVWNDPLDPGKYPINPYTHKVSIVPTANVVLNWATGKSEAHQLDKNLSTITVRSADGFTFNLDVSQIIHIPRNDAPKVIARLAA